jgi:hypothetical protein
MTSWPMRLPLYLHIHFVDLTRWLGLAAARRKDAQRERGYECYSRPTRAKPRFALILATGSSGSQRVCSPWPSCTIGRNVAAPILDSKDGSGWIPPTSALYARRVGRLGGS